MLDLLLLPSPTSKSTHPIDRADAPLTPSSTVASLRQDSSTHSMCRLMSAFTVSSFGSGLPLTLPDSSASGWQSTSHRRRSSVMGKESVQHNGAVTQQRSSFNDSASASAERRQLYSTPAPLLQTTRTDVAPGQIERVATALYSSQWQPRLEKPVEGGTAAAHSPPPALTPLAEASAPMNASDAEKREHTRSTTPTSSPVYADAASVRNRNTAVVAAADAAVTIGTSSRGSDPPTVVLEPKWVDYDVYLRLSAPLLRQRSLQDRVAQLCCASSTTAHDHRRLVCLDSVFSFLLHGSAVAPPIVTPTVTPVSADQLPISGSSCGSLDEAQRMCFPLFCLLGAKLCALAEPGGVIRSVHTSTPPMSLSQALHPQGVEGGPNAAAPRTYKSVGRQHVLLLFAEQLMDAYPDFPRELLYTTSPGGAIVSAPPPETATYWHSWQATPREARQSESYDALWSVITLRRFAVLMERWGVSPAAASEKLCLTASSTTTAAEVVLPQTPEADGESSRLVVPRQLMLHTVDSNSHLSVPLHHLAMNGEDDATALQHRGESVPAATAIIAGTPALNCPRPLLPYPPYTRPPPPPPQQQSNVEHISCSNSGTAISSSVWDCASSSKAAVPGRGDYTPATAAAVRPSAARSRRTRHEAALTSSSFGTPLPSDCTDRLDDMLAESAEGGHPYNAPVAAGSSAVPNATKERCQHRQVHRYNVPSPPQLPPSTSAAAAAQQDSIASFLRSFARNGGVVPAAVSKNTSLEVWNSKQRASPTYLPAPPKHQSPQQQQQQHRHSHHNRTTMPTTAVSVSALSTRMEGQRYNDASTPLPSRPMTADMQRRPPTVPMSRKEFALHPYNVAAAAAAAAPSSLKGHRKSHKHRSSSSRRHHTRGDQGCAAATRTAQSSNRSERQENVRSNTGVNAAEASLQGAGSERSAGGEKVMEQADRGGSARNARKRTQQVNAYVKDLLEATAEARKRNDSADSACVNGQKSEDRTDPQCRRNNTELSDAATTIPATSLEGVAHAQSHHSNTSANANSLNRGRLVKAAGITSSADGAAAPLNAARETPSGTHQENSTEVRHVPAPPLAPQPPSQSQRSHLHTNILQSWESSMLGQCDSSGHIGAASATAAEGAAPAERSEQWSPTSPVDAAPFLDRVALIPSIASSQSQLSVFSAPIYQGVANGQEVTPMAGPHQRDAEGAVTTGRSDVSSQPTALYLSSAGASIEIPVMPDGVGTAESAVLLVSHTPDRGFVVTSLTFPPHTAAHAADGSVREMRPLGAAVEKAPNNHHHHMNKATSLPTSSPPSLFVTTEECRSLPTAATDNTSDLHADSVVSKQDAPPPEQKSLVEAEVKIPPQDSENVDAVPLRPVPASPPARGITVPVVTAFVSPTASVPPPQPLQPQQQQGTTAARNDGPLSEPAELYVEDAEQPPSADVSPDVLTAVLTATYVPTAAVPLQGEKSDVTTRTVPLRLGIAAQLRGLIAPVLQAVGRGYLARHALGAAAALHRTHPRSVTLEEDTFTIDGASPATSAGSFPPTPGLDAVAVAAAFPAEQASFQNSSMNHNSDTATSAAAAAATAVGDPPPGASSTFSPAPVTAPRSTHKVRPPPLTAFAAPESRAVLRTPVTQDPLPAADASVNDAAKKVVKLYESSGLDAAPRNTTHDGGLLHRSSPEPQQRLFAVFGVPGNSVSDISSSLGQSAAYVTYFASHDETGMLESKLPRSIQAVEQSMDTSRFSSLFLPWSKDGTRGNREGMAASHTLPPSKEEESSFGSTGGDEKGSGLQRTKRKDGPHCMTSTEMPPTEGVSESALLLSLMRPIATPSRDRLTEDPPLSLRGESTEDWINLLHSRFGAGGSCTVAFVGQTANGPLAGSTTSNTLQDSAGSYTRTSSDPAHPSNSLDNTWVMHSAMCLLRFQRIGRGYLARQQLAQRYRDAREEENLDALLKHVLLDGPSLPASPSTATGGATSVGRLANNTVLYAEGNNFNGDNENRTRLGSAVATRGSAVFSVPPSTQPVAVSATPQSTLSAVVAAPSLESAGSNGMVRTSSDLDAPPTPPVAVRGPPLSPFQVLSEGYPLSAQSSGSADVAAGAKERASVTMSSESASKSGNLGGAGAGAAVDTASNRARENSPFVTPDTSRYFLPPALTSPNVAPTAQRPSQSLEIDRSSSLSLSKEAPANGVCASAGPNIVTALGSALTSNTSAAPETPSLPPSTSRRRGAASPSSVRVSFSRDSYTPLIKINGPEFPPAVANAIGVPPAAATPAAEAPARKSPRAKMVEGVKGPFYVCRSSPPAEAEVSSGNFSGGGSVAAVAAAFAAAAAAPTAIGSSAGGFVTGTPATPVDSIPRWKATSAAAGAIMSPLEGSIFAASGRSGRSMVSANSFPFEFSTTAHAASAMSPAELMFSGRTIGSMTPAHWTLDGVEAVESTSHFDDGESASEDNEDSDGSSDSDEEAEDVNNSDDDANEADAFKKDITHVEEGGAEPACFGAAAHLLRGEGALLTKENALSLLQRVGRGYLCRRHEHFLFMVSISFAEVALLQRVAVAYLVRRKMGLEFQVNRLVKEEMAYWELRNQAAIKLHAVVRGFIARQRVKRLQRKLFTRIEMRTALELPDPDE
ncbi:hypothetical protein ABB37_02824 [Leptomonas pyrrhocoris]|uniref:Uncharacterized protein n=1 Tax=Leptomonas pyrrhocoris TaxID=157538 RepID=A0A0N1J540_LEPPY|nr:hypothetical protein ABB37_02824 [Leptomonas pyrrhocoris]KPA83118.1 hypothetical protein ABB37_02824 [Leptomonas pyrrhocoris]|eukprot:XP_015661557.1 hypothetical protein ABB37_02824 [Leptomonas pyrrhocoris]